ncbi:GNAT family N-acetyltransferase [Henriciella sp.]|uniref:GNAT family N-acetyltransferase n=1 Tax=Henriciella sp. TaxID=1968823 RepID=UPI002616053D|nr:GNAT family N-acetyltransferase [Henriciella sp.]
MKIRTYRAADAPRMEDIFRRAVREIGRHFYTDDQVTAWSGPRVTAEQLNLNYMDGRATFIAEDETGRAIAFSDLEADGHVDMLYCDPDHARKGIASALLAAIERDARACGIDRLYTEASEAARPVFQKAGFTVVRRRELEVDGVAIHNWAMEKPLD